MIVSNKYKREMNEEAARQKFLEEKKGEEKGKESQKEQKESRATISQYRSFFRIVLNKIASNI